MSGKGQIVSHSLDITRATFLPLLYGSDPARLLGARLTLSFAERAWVLCWSEAKMREPDTTTIPCLVSFSQTKRDRGKEMVNCEIFSSTLQHYTMTCIGQHLNRMLLWHSHHSKSCHQAMQLLFRNMQYKHVITHQFRHQASVFNNTAAMRI